jgi:hypothetical protein
MQVIPCFYRNITIIKSISKVWQKRGFNMRILFLNIAWMKCFKGIYPGVDEPKNGGSYVKENSDAHEKYNFFPCDINGKFNNEEVCLGYVSTKSTNGEESNQLHIEKIEGAHPEDDLIDDVLVIWCAKQAHYDNRTVVVGWYKDARVHRNYQVAEFQYEDGEIEEQYFTAIAKAENCVLLPECERSRFTKWNIPRKGHKGAAFGFGSANVWFAREDRAQDFVKKLVDTINNYDGENWLRRFPV